MMMFIYTFNSNSLSFSVDREFLFQLA